MNNNRWKIIFLMICFNNTVSSSFGQSIEELYGLNFPQWDCFQRVIPYLRTLDSTQMREDGSYLLRLEYKNNYKGKKTGIPMVLSSDCRLIFSRTILLPPPAKKEERIVVSLNCKTEIDSLRFLVTARDKYENILFIDSLIIQPTHPFINYSISFTRSETRTVTIMIGREGCHETLNQKSIYFDKITIHRGEEDLNTFPITSLVKKKDLRLKTKAIIPLSSQTESTLKKIHDWKDKKLIALGESIYGLQDLMEIQIQMLKHLILWENCRLVIMDMSQNQCVRWNLYLQGKEPDSYKEELLNELSKTVHSPVVFLEFLQWVRDYNTSAADAVRIIGITNGKSIDYSCMSDYLWKLSTNLQDSMFYSKALKQSKFTDIKKYVEQSPLTLKEKEHQYLLFLIDEMEEVRKRPFIPNTFLVPLPDTSQDEDRRIAMSIENFLSAEQKAVFIATSIRINKSFPIQDFEIMEEGRKTNNHDLGQLLYKRYGKQYHAVSIQFGDRTCLIDSVYWAEGSIINHSFPVNWHPLFPFSFEKAAMDSKISYFYYPSDQIPAGIGGLNLFPNRSMSCKSPFCNSYIPLHFDALVFIRQAEGFRNTGPGYGPLELYFRDP